jgi:hypothetical protein
MSWIPGQVRNDNKADMRRFVNCDTVWKAGIQNLFVGFTGFLWMPASEGMTGKTPRLFNYLGFAFLFKQCM